MFTVDIDTGGTMTDALVADGARRHAFKVDTTPHDFTVAFVSALGEAAKHFGIRAGDGATQEDLREFLRQVKLIRWSSTISTNVLAERRGSKVGLLVSKGHEDDLYGEGRSPVIGELIAREAVIGLSPNPSDAEVLGAVKRLLESGVRRICVSLKGAFPDNRAERAVKAVIEGQYPDHILGAVPVLLGSEMAQIGHDQTRAHCSLMNAYTHNQLAGSLFKAEDLLRDTYGWNGALLVGHTNGGVSRIGKTKALDTIESGPVFGTFGGAFVARQYGLANVVCFDVGGTTTKASIVRNGEPVFQRGGELMGVPVATAFAMLRSAPTGGGSIARVKSGRLTLGPESQGAAPGPASYVLGGREATLTDALLLLGYLDADSFLGGRRKLSREHAQKVIEKNVARPLGVSIEQAALLIRDEAVAMMAELIAVTLAEAGLAATDTALFAFGGNGPMFGALVAERLGIAKAYAFDFGPVFGAFGSSISEVAHVYERSIGLSWTTANAPTIQAAARALHLQAGRDLAGEGFAAAAARYAFEFEFGRDEKLAGQVRCEFEGEPDAAFIDKAGEAIAAIGFADSSEPLLLLRLSAHLPVGAHGLQPRAGSGAKPAVLSRPMQFSGRGPEILPVHVWEQLGVGDCVQGPAMINGATLTCPVPPGWSLSVDTYGTAELKKAG